MKPTICLSVSAFSSTGRQRTTRKSKTTTIAPPRKPSHARSLASQRSPKLSPSAIKSNILSRRRRRNGEVDQSRELQHAAPFSTVFFQLLNVSPSNSSVVQAGRDERASYPRGRESGQITSIAYASRSIDCARLGRRLNGTKPLHVRSRAAADSIQRHNDQAMRPSVRVRQ